VYFEEYGLYATNESLTIYLFDTTTDNKPNITNNIDNNNNNNNYHETYIGYYYHAEKNNNNNNLLITISFQEHIRLKSVIDTNIDNIITTNSDETNKYCDINGKEFPSIVLYNLSNSYETIMLKNNDSKKEENYLLLIAWMWY